MIKNIEIRCTYEFGNSKTGKDKLLENKNISHVIFLIIYQTLSAH